MSALPQVSEPTPHGEMRTAKQWSLLTGIPVSTILAAVRRGDIEAFQYMKRGHVFIREEEMNDFIDKARRRAASDEE